MLAFLTGGRQVGKTRLLEKAIDEARVEGANPIGLLTPGVWIENNDGSLLKTGINALVLPEGRQIPFAVNANYSDGSASTHQSDSAGLGWKIFDESIDDINRQFDSFAERGINPIDLLIVDELGTLELVRGQGLISAMSLLENPSFEYPTSELNAIVVIRPELIDSAKKRFAPIWGEPLVIDASEEDAYLGIESLIRSLSSVSDKS